MIIAWHEYSADEWCDAITADADADAAADASASVRVVSAQEQHQFSLLLPPLFLYSFWLVPGILFG